MPRFKRFQRPFKQASLLFASLQIAFAVCAGEPDSPGFLRLRNGDIVPADLLGSDADESFFYAFAEKAPLRVPHENIEAWVRAPEASPVSSPLPIIHFENGDSLRAEVTAADAENIFVKSDWGQALQLDRDAIEYISFPAPPDELLYHGPQPLAAWNQTPRNRVSGSNTFASDTWHEMGGGIFSAGRDKPGLTHPLPPLPPRYLLSIRYRFTPPMFRFGLAGSTRDDKNKKTMWMELNYPFNSLYYENETRAEGRIRNYFPSRDEVDMRGSLQLYVNAESSEVSAYLDGKALMNWRSEAELKTPKELFIRPLQGGHMFIAGVKVEAWNGILPKDRLEAPHVVVQLHNADTYNGNFTDIPAGKLRLQPVDPEKSVLEIPLKSIRQLSFPKSKTALWSNQRYQSSLRLNDGATRLSMTSLRLEDGEITATHPGIKTQLHFPMSLVHAVGFEHSRPPADALTDLWNGFQFRHRDGSVFSGRFTGMADHRFRIQTIWAEEEVSFSPDSFESIRMSLPPLQDTLNSPVSLQFKNGDQLAGTWGTVQAGILEWKLPQGETLALRLSEISRIDFNDPDQPPWIDSFGRVEDWIRYTKQNTPLKEGRLEESAPNFDSLGVYYHPYPKTPDPFVAEFTYPKGHYLSMVMTPVAYHPRNRPTQNNTGLSISRKFLNYRRQGERVLAHSMKGNINVSETIQLIFFPTLNQMEIRIDGKSIKTMAYDFPKELGSYWFWLQVPREMEILTQTEFKVQPWHEPRRPSKQWRIESRDGNSISGELVAFHPQAIEIKHAILPEGTQIPFSNLGEILPPFQLTADETATKQDTLLRLHGIPGGLQGKILSVTPEAIKLESPNGPKPFEIPTDSIRRIDYSHPPLDEQPPWTALDWMEIPLRKPNY